MLPLSGVRVLDFSTLLPGPMATLLLAEAGAEVIKIERPESGEELRQYQPRFADTSVSLRDAQPRQAQHRHRPEGGRMRWIGCARCSNPPTSWSSSSAPA